jgi:cytochrome c oxidase subunit 2
MVAAGQRLATSAGCPKCHSVDGSRHIGPTWLDLYHKVEDLEGGGRVFVDEGYITESMMEPKAKQVAGYPLVMPSFHGRLSAPETAAIVEYIKSLRTSFEDRPREGPVFEPTPGAPQP